MSSQKSMKNGSSSSSSKKSTPSKSPAGIKTIERVLSWVSGSSEKSKGDAPPSPADPQTIVGALIPQYIKSLPPKSESATKNKGEVHVQLIKRKDRVRDKLRSGFEKNKVVAGDHVNELCSKLDRELTAVINAYIKSISEVASKNARDVINTLLSKDPGQAGISLPALSETKINDAITIKKQEFKKQMMKQLSDRFHVSWYIDDSMNEFIEQQMEGWGEIVRIRSRELSKHWTMRGSILLLAMVPLVLSILFSSSSSRQPYCKPGYYHRSVSLDEDIEEDTGGFFGTILSNKGPVQECAICPAGKYSTGGGGGMLSYLFGSSSSCKSCGKNTFTEKKGSGKCLPCPPHSQSLKSIGSIGCECMDYATQISNPEKGQGKALVCKSNKVSYKSSNKRKGTASSKQGGKGKNPSSKSNNKNAGKASSSSKSSSGKGRRKKADHVVEEEDEDDEDKQEDEEEMKDDDDEGDDEDNAVDEEEEDIKDGEEDEEEDGDDDSGHAIE